MSLNPVGGNALAGTAVGSAHEAPAVVLGGGESGELPTRSATRLDFLEDELTSPDDLFADVARDPKTGSVRVSSPKGTREWSASALSDHGMPVVAERAYRNAARRMAGTDPACQLPWTLLAGIGRVESDHGRYGGSTLGRDGVSHPLIIGVQLNGAGPVAAIPDSDNGKLDKDKVWDRAVGPMQFIPTTWATAGRDGDGDGVASPNDIDDATLAAAGYLCSGSGSVLSEAGMAAALLRYNPSDSYVALVMAFERGYRTGSFVMPAPVEPETSQGARSGRGKAGARGNSKTSPAKPKPSRGPSGGPSATPDPRPAPEPKPPATPKPTPKPPKPTPKPTPKPPKPPKPPKSTEPVLDSVSGTFQACGSRWCLDGSPLDLGPPSQLSAGAAADFDGNGTVGSNSEEFAGLRQVTLLVERVGAGQVVYAIGGENYRFADGSFA